MREFRVRTDIERRALGDYQLPLGVERASLPEPVQGYVLTSVPETDREPATWLFQVCVSHERLRTVADAAFNLLPRKVTAVVEIGSRDAYRSVDVYVTNSEEGSASLVEFLRTWYEFEEFLLEDVSIGAGANSEEPFMEVFVDSWKGLLISVPDEMRDEVSSMLEGLGLQEVEETWSAEAEKEDAYDPKTEAREVLELVDEHSPDLDELLLVLRDRWALELNVDPETNVDEGGRHLGMTLWHAIVLAGHMSGDLQKGAYISVWLTAGSLAQAEELLADALLDQREWGFESVYSFDRVAFDDRPPDLQHLAPVRRRAAVHATTVDPWGEEGQARPELPGRES